MFSLLILALAATSSAEAPPVAAQASVRIEAVVRARIIAAVRIDLSRALPRAGVLKQKTDTIDFE
jgi:hypothetical protein